MPPSAEAFNPANDHCLARNLRQRSLEYRLLVIADNDMVRDRVIRTSCVLALTLVSARQSAFPQSWYNRRPRRVPASTHTPHASKTLTSPQTPHSSRTSPAQLHLSEEIPLPPQTPQRSTTLPLFGTLSHPAQLEPCPPHTPQPSITSPPQLHLPEGIPEPPHTCRNQS